MNKLFLILFFLLPVHVASAQAPVLHGQLTGPGGSPVAGAVVTLQQARTVTLSSADGNFSISCRDAGDSVYITAPGFQSKTIAAAHFTAAVLLIHLDTNEKQLEEVIVNTGYQKVARERATGSFSSVSKTVLQQQAGTFLVDRLESVSNGLYIDRQTGGQPKIVIRGLSTILGPRAPLIVLDDFPYEGNLNNIDPNEVESVTILKDAAAASIWGTRAGNGVIVITTKKGRYNQPLKIEFSTAALLSEKPDLGYINDIAPSDYVGVEKFLYSKGYYSTQFTSQPYLGLSPVVELLRRRDLGAITAAQADSGIAAIGNHDLRDDFSKYVYRQGLNLQQALNLSGGSKQLAWNLGLGWERDRDNLDSRYNRYTLRSFQAFHISRNLELQTGIDYAQGLSRQGKTGYGALRPYTGNMPVYTRLVGDDGAALPVVYQYRKAYTDTAAAGKLLDWGWYPLTDYRNLDKTSILQSVLASAGLSWKLNSALNLSIKYQYGRQVITDKTAYSPESYYARNYVNQYTSINRSTGVLTYRVPKGGILDNGMSSQETQSIRGQLSFSRNLGSHSVDAIAGTEYRQINNDSRTNRSYGYNADILTSGAVDYTTAYPNILTGSSTYIPDMTTYSGTLNRYVSFFANAAYSFRRRYTLSASARRDASNLFGAGTNNRWTPLWSAGAAWDIAKERFYRLAWLPSLKVRLTYGRSGNADPLRSAVTTIVYNSISTYTGMPVASISQFENPGLRWERVSMWNGGIDFAGRWLSGSLEYYYKRGTDLFGTSPVDYTALAFNTITKNVASIAGHGWDINLNSRNTSGKVSWSSQLNLNFNRDKVLRYYLVNKQGSNFTLGSNVSAIEGRPVYALYDYKWAGLDPATGDPLGYLNGVVSKDYASITGSGTQVTDMAYIGPTLPTAVASLGNTFSWKRLSLAVRITGKFGNYFQRSSIDYSALFTNRSGNRDYALRWQKPGDELVTSVPSMVYPLNTQRNNFYRSAEVLATKADFVRLQYVTLSYDMPGGSIQFYVNAANLGLLWRANHYGIDPEYNTGLPPVKTIALGVRATF